MFKNNPKLMDKSMRNVNDEFFIDDYEKQYTAETIGIFYGVKGYPINVEGASDSRLTDELQIVNKSGEPTEYADLGFKWIRTKAPSLERIQGLRDELESDDLPTLFRMWKELDTKEMYSLDEIREYKKENTEEQS